MSDLAKIKATSFSTLTNIEIDDIKSWDYPTFCDAFICAASYADGTELTDEELEVVNDDSSFVYDRVIDWLY